MWESDMLSFTQVEFQYVQVLLYYRIVQEEVWMDGWMAGWLAEQMDG